MQEAAITRFHATYFAHELTKRCPSDSVQKLAATLADAQVDLNPHQIDAALFAFRSPLSKGAILADEVGLGKTIEAGILLSQRWAERKRKLLVIVPAKLDRWGEDQRNSLKSALKELEDQIKDTRKQARLAHNLPEKLKLEREKRQLETKRDEAWRAYDIAAKEIERRKDALMDEVEQKLNQQLKEDTLFLIRWTLK